MCVFGLGYLVNDLHILGSCHAEQKFKVKSYSKHVQMYLSEETTQMPGKAGDCTRIHLKSQSFQGPEAGPGPRPIKCACGAHSFASLSHYQVTPYPWSNSAPPGVFNPRSAYEYLPLNWDYLHKLELFLYRWTRHFLKDHPNC